MYPAEYPTPSWVSSSEADTKVRVACVDTSALASHVTLDALVVGVVHDAGLALGAAKACDWQLTFASGDPPLSGSALATWSAAGGNEERYAVVTQTNGVRATSTLHAANERAGLYALRAALDFTSSSVDGVKVGPAVVVDAPEIAWRGLVEGIYGHAEPGFDTQYSPAERALLIRLASRLRENTYIYGPKNDPYARSAWTVPYPSTGVGNAQAITLAAREADANLVRFVWSLSPQNYWSDPTASPATNLVAAKAKIDSVRALGVHHFALFADDNVVDCNAGHRTPCSDAQIADQAALANALDDYVKTGDPSDHLLFVWWDYSGFGDQYTSALGKLLAPDIETMWTGPTVRSCTITASDISRVNASLGRRVSIWDNWPIDQTTISASSPGCGAVPIRMTGRAPDLPIVIGGFYTNPVLNQASTEAGTDMRYPLLSGSRADFIGQLGPIADYAWAPTRYSVDASYAAWATREADDVAKASDCGATCATSGWSCGTPDAIAWCDAITGCKGEATCAAGCTAGAPPQCE